MEYVRQIGKVAKAYESVTVSSTKIGLTAATLAGKHGAMITVEAAQIRFRVDGGDPTTTVGHILEAGDSYSIDSTDNLANFLAIRTGTTDGVIKVTYWVWAAK